MSLFRFSLIGLAGLVAVIAVGCASLVYATPWLSQSIWLIIFLLLAFAVVAALMRSPPQRSWWIGAAVFGWLYVLTINGPLVGPGKLFAIDNLLEKAALRMPKGTMTVEDPFQGSGGGGMGGFGGMSGMDPGMMPDGGMMPGMGGTAPATYQAQNTEYITAFIRTSQGLIALVLMGLGGFAAQLIQGRNVSQKRLVTRPGAPRE